MEALTLWVVYGNSGDVFHLIDLEDERRSIYAAVDLSAPEIFYPSSIRASAEWLPIFSSVQCWIGFKMLEIGHGKRVSISDNKI